MVQFVNTDRDDVGKALSRRRLLGSAGVLAGSTGLAGCLGGGGGNVGGGGDRITCGDLTSGYTLYDSGETAFVFDVELPAVVIDNAEYKPIDGVPMLSAGRLWENGDELVIQVRGSPDGDKEPRFESGSDLDEGVEQSGTLSFNGEERPIYRYPPSKPEGAERTVELPYEVDGERFYFWVDLRADSGFAESTDECLPAFDEVAEHMTRSLTPNEDSTRASEMQS